MVTEPTPPTADTPKGVTKVNVSTLPTNPVADKSLFCTVNLSIRTTVEVWVCVIDGVFVVPATPVRVLDRFVTPNFDTPNRPEPYLADCAMTAIATPYAIRIIASDAFAVGN
tara:strand:- start:22 stop:357 length:336 start_codon:yes stop_codon:yes gene_type:complete